jgi:hypothetical protein
MLVNNRYLQENPRSPAQQPEITFVEAVRRAALENRQVLAHSRKNQESSSNAAAQVSRQDEGAMHHADGREDAELPDKVLHITTLFTHAATFDNVT